MSGPTVDRRSYKRSLHALLLDRRLTWQSRVAVQGAEAGSVLRPNVASGNLDVTNSNMSRQQACVAV
jgi:hypothetical protein